jgi:hypothetical protein
MFRALLVHHQGLLVDEQVKACNMWEFNVFNNIIVN